jgi:hypothetical protein
LQFLSFRTKNPYAVKTAQKIRKSLLINIFTYSRVLLLFLKLCEPLQFEDLPVPNRKFPPPATTPGGADIGWRQLGGNMT